MFSPENVAHTNNLAPSQGKIPIKVGMFTFIYFYINKNLLVDQKEVISPQKSLCVREESRAIKYPLKYYYITWEIWDIFC